MTTVKAIADAAAAPAAGAGRVRRRLLVAGRVVLAAAVVFAVAYATVSQWNDVHAYLLGLAWPAIVSSLALVMLGIAAATLGWRTALAHLGHPIPVRTAARIYLIGLMAKYVPGSVWAFVLQMELGKRARLPRSRPFLASLVLTGIGTTIALSLGLLALPALLNVGGALLVAVLVLVPLALVCAHPRVLTWLLNRVLALLRRPPLPRTITWRAVVSVGGLCMISWLCFGVHLWLLANTSTAPSWSGLLRCIGAIALGITAGMLAFVTPSGLGAREAIIVAALLPYTSAGTALGTALASRMIFIAGDLITAAAAALSGLTFARLARLRGWRRQPSPSIRPGPDARPG